MATLVIPQAHGSQSFTTAGTYSFTVPLSNVSQITVIAQGGGGGGSASTSTYSDSTWLEVGGAGGVCIKTVSVTGGEVFTVVVGAAGAYGSLGTNVAGGNGGASTFSGNGVSMSAAGGLGGVPTDTDTWPTAVASSGGDYNYPAVPGLPSYAGDQQTASAGMASLFANGGANASGSNVSGGSGTEGSGGGSLSGGSSNWGSGTGGAGVVIVIW